MNNPIKLLIVDDHQMVLDGIKSMLANHPHIQVVGEALSASQAFNIIEENPSICELVLTDISMPEVSGITLCKQIKTNYPNIKVMVVSMHDDVDNIKNALSAEADGYMLKNITQTEFIAGITLLLENGLYYSQQIVPLLAKQISAQKNTTKSNLSKRELEILELIAKEFTSREIAEKLYISKLTVDSHRINLLEKTGSKSLVGLIKYAIKIGLVQI